MNFDELQKTWAQQTVAGQRVDSAQLRAELAREVRQRSRSIRRIIGVATFVFVTGWGVSLTAHFTGIKPFNAVTLSGFIIGSVFDLACLIAAVRALRRMRREELGMGETLADTLQTSLRAVEQQMRDCRLFGYAIAIGLAGATGLTLLYYFTDNLPRRGALANLALTVTLVAGIAATLRRYYRRQLVPRRAELLRAIAELQGDGPALSP